MRVEIVVLEDRDASDERDEWRSGRRLEGWVEIDPELADFDAEDLFRALMGMAARAMDGQLGGP